MTERTQLILFPLIALVVSLAVMEIRLGEVLSDREELREENRALRSNVETLLGSCEFGLPDSGRLEE